MKTGDQNSEIEKKFVEVHEQIGFHCEKMENQPKEKQNNSRRNSIRIDGIPE